MLDVCCSLQSGTPTEIEATIAHIRNHPEWLSALDAAKHDAKKVDSAVDHTMRPAAGLHEPVIAQRQPETQQSMPRLSKTSSDTSATSSFQSSGAQTVDETSTKSWTSASRSSQDGLVDLPEKDVAYAAIMNFYKCAGKLFHVFPTKEALDIWQAVYERGEHDSSVRLCQMFGIMAIGLQFANDAASADLGIRSYHVAKDFLDDALEADRLEATKILVCLAMYNIMRKSTVALSYIELGLSITRRFGLHERVQPPDMSVDRWWELKRVWRTFMFLESWLTSTLGYMSDISSSLTAAELLKEMEIPHDAVNGIFDVVQAEMAKVSLLTARVVRMLYTSRETDMRTVAGITAELREWHQKLTPEVQLSTAVNSAASPELLVPILFIHMIYYGAFMLVHKRILFQASHGEDLLSLNLYQKASDHREVGANAARASAKILGRLHNDNLVFKRCWLVIFHSFNSAVVLLHNVSQKLQRHEAKETLTSDFTLVDYCIQLLSFSSHMDPAAKHFLNVLTPHYDLLMSYRNAHPALDMLLVRPQNQALGTPKDLSATSESLMELLWSPFNDMHSRRSLEVGVREADSRPSRQKRQHLSRNGSNTILPPLPDRKPLPINDKFRFEIPLPLSAPKLRLGESESSVRPDLCSAQRNQDYTAMNGFITPNTVERMGWSLLHETNSFSEQEPWTKRRKTGPENGSHRSTT